MEGNLLRKTILILILFQLGPHTALSKVLNEEILEDVTAAPVPVASESIPELATVPEVPSSISPPPPPVKSAVVPDGSKEEEIFPKFRLFGDVTTPALLPTSNLTIIAESIKSGDHNSTILEHGGGAEPWSIFPSSKLSCSCGKTHEFKIPDDEKIVGGEQAYIRDYPWTVALVRRQTTGFGGQPFPFCGGTLINARYVITASHCVDGQEARGIQILINEQDLLTSTEAKTMRVDIERITMHEGYNRHNIDNDIALIRLAQTVDISSYDVITRPACLTSSSFDFAGSTAVVAGWGATNEGSSTSNTLRKVDVPVISNQDCNDKTTYNGKITDNMLCAGLVDEGGKDSCQGDSGGPLIAVYGGRKTLIGVVSWGHGCARPRSPGVYTRVSRYASWILKNTGDEYWCDGYKRLN